MRKEKALMEERINKLTVLRVIACIVLVVLSITVLEPHFSKPETYKNTIEKLDEKQKTVLGMTFAATASSIGVAAIPGDATTPVANKIMDLSGYLIFVLCIIIIEKFLLTMIGYAAFLWVIPIICVLVCINTFLKSQFIAKLAMKLGILIAVMLVMVPVSVKLSDMVEATHNVSIETEYDDEVQKAVDSVEQRVEIETNKDGNGIKKSITGVENIVESVGEEASKIAKNALDTTMKFTGEAIEKAQELFWNLVEVIVVLMVTNCIIPVLVFAFLLWLINMLVGIQISVPDPAKFTRKMHFKKKAKES